MASRSISFRALWLWISHISTAQWVVSVAGGAAMTVLSFIWQLPWPVIVTLGLVATAAILTILRAVGWLGGGNDGFPPPNKITPPEPTEEFPYPYPKSMMRLAIPHLEGRREAMAGAAPHKLTVMASIESKHNRILTECLVVCKGYKKDGVYSSLNRTIRVGGDGPFTVSQDQAKSFYLLKRDISDSVTPEPFLLKMVGGDFPLEENSTYIFEMEMRCKYPLPTIAFVQVTTKEGLGVLVSVIEHRLGRANGQ